MFKTFIAAAAALTLMSGVGFAQSSSASTSTTQTIAPVAPTHDADVTTTTQRTAGRNGVLIEKDTVGTDTSTAGSPGSIRTDTATTKTTH